MGQPASVEDVTEYTPLGILTDMTNQRITRQRRPLLALLGAGLAAVLTLGACASSDSSSTQAAELVANGAVLIDVRTPGEFSSGHLEGALNIDVQSPSFDALVSTLDPAGTYLVYCRSGNRSKAAIARMKSLGFGELVDLGSVASASSATGVRVVS
jgi:phage shock protein E